MKRARKKTALVKAYRLGEEGSAVDRLIEEGKIRLREDGSYEVFSQEAKGGAGETAHAGDYIKIDASGSPYPNSRAFFEAHHLPAGDGFYRQKMQEVSVWMWGDPVGPEVRYLMEHKGLTLCGNDPERYFRAPLWGTELTAARDAVLVFYRILRDKSGEIRDAEFNFVARDEFDKTYEMVQEEEGQSL